jgi:hypothetical protein
MAGLVAINSLPLAAAVLAPVAGRRIGWRAPGWLVPLCLTISACVMVALAVNQLRDRDACPLCAHHG